MGRFAHLADVHLGFQKFDSLKKIEQDTFEDIVSQCISRKVDFVLICGDLFHVNIPDMGTNTFAFEQFRLLKEAGIPVYAVYGSHDFSPVSKSIIDLLQAAGLITKVSVQEDTDNKIRLGFITDPKTGAKIAGLPGLKAGRETDLYGNLDREALKAEEGFKIFLFHGAISELVSDTHGDSMALSLLPPGFEYYAGGHLHKRKPRHRYTRMEYPGYPYVVYPGTPFCGYHSDLEQNARGEERGFVLVDFDDSVTNVEFVAIENAKYEIIDMDCKSRNAIHVDAELRDCAKSINPQGKIIIIKLAGELTMGKTADIDTAAIKGEMMEAGALAVNIHKNQLTSKEYNITGVKGKNRGEITHNIFAENIGEVRTRQEELAGESGVSLAKTLLEELAQPKQDNEKKWEYEQRVNSRALGAMEIDVNDS